MMIRLNWAFRNRAADISASSDARFLLNDNFIRLDNRSEFSRWPEKRPSHEALVLCNCLKTGSVPEYFERLANMPRRKIIRIFQGIISSKSSGLPVLYDKEMPPVIIRGTSFDTVPNVQSRMMTKITLLTLVKSESQKLGIWNLLQPQWMEKYTYETKMYVRILEVIAGQGKNGIQTEKINELNESIKHIKTANLEYNINW